MRRASLLALIGLFALIVPAHAAGTPYPTVHYGDNDKAAGDAAIGPLPAPSLDITGVTYGFDGHNLRMTAKLTAASKSAPLPFLEEDFTWQFKLDKAGKVIAYVNYSRWTITELNINFSPYSVGAVVGGAQTPSSATCPTCVGTINLSKGEAEFSIGLDDLNAMVTSVVATAPQVAKGSTIYPTEADTLVGFPPLGSVLSADVALAPPKFRFTL
ncbi:MAG: hypothetical protein ACYDH6_23770 [Acidimicrobiales bacterium]